MEDVEYYLDHFPQPEFCFTPDAVFPLICGEKGRLYAEVARKADGGPDARIESLEGGTVANAIPREASAVVRCDHMPPADERIDVEALGEGRYRIAATGIGGHASMPEGTCNAIGVLVNYLLDQGICSQAEREFLAFERTLLADSYGRELGIAAEDEVFDPLTCVGGVLRIDDGDEGARFVQTIDIRYPSSTTAARMLARIGEVAERHGCAIVASEDTAPFYIAPDADEIRLLCDTYRRETGRDATPITIGGGTYARHFARAVAFGPDDPAEPAPSWVGQEHGPNEGVAEALLRRALAIYIVAIARLAWR